MFLTICQISFFLSSYIVPLALISILYMGMLARLWKAVPGSKVSAESRRGKKRVTRLVVVVVLGFSICWLPIQVRLDNVSLIKNTTQFFICLFGKLIDLSIFFIFYLLFITLQPSGHHYY